VYSARQFFGILTVNLAGVTARLGSVLTIIIGVACTVGALVAMLAMDTGARRQEMGNVRDDRVILRSTGARGIESNIPRGEAILATALPGIRRDAEGAPEAVLEAFVPSEGHRRGTGTRIFMPIIGSTTNLTDYMPELHFTAGRMFRRGLYELIASDPCVRQFQGFELGASRPLHGAQWTVVGHFERGEDQQCVVFADVETLMATFNRTTYSGVAVRLESPAQYDTLRAALKADPALHLEARREREELEEQFKGLNSLLNFVSYFIGTIMAIGATLGAMNSLYAIVDSRRRELATLRAIGFGSGVIIASVLCESILLALPGALLGSALAWLLFNGLSASPFGYSFNLQVTPSLIELGVGWSLAMGLLGGLLPALRAARVPVTTALRAT